MSLSTEISFWIVLGIIALQIMKITYHGCYLLRKEKEKNNRINESRKSIFKIKKKFIHLLLCLSISLVSWSVDAHQPVLSFKSANTAKAPYIIEEPEISKAIFTELK